MCPGSCVSGTSTAPFRTVDAGRDWQRVTGFWPSLQLLQVDLEPDATAAAAVGAKPVGERAQQVETAA